MPTTVTNSTSLDRSFTRYVQRRKRAAAAQLREGTIYAFGGDLRIRRQLGRVRPVGLAIEAALRHFQQEGKRRLIADATTAGHPRHGLAMSAVQSAAHRLGVTFPETHVVTSAVVHDLLVLGPSDEPVVLLPSALIEQLTDDELLATAGQACGRIHNQHTALSTAIYLLEGGDDLGAALGTALRWAARPAAMALATWAQRAALTADRASLLVARDFTPTAAALIKRLCGLKQLVGDVDPSAWLAAFEAGVEDPPDGQRIDRVSWRWLVLRLRALRLFERTSYYQGGQAAAATTEAGSRPATGSAARPGNESALSLQACEVAVSNLLAGAA